jgi:2'-5' RNA ligase
LSDSADPNQAALWRLFVALVVPDAVRHEFAAAQTEFRKAVRHAHIRWAPQNQFHLTLAFLGDVEVLQIASLEAALRAACQPFAPLSLTARSVGFFPERGKPRVIWAGISDPANRLADLQRAVAGTVAPFAGTPVRDDFTGHITLGRVKVISGPETAILHQAAISYSQRDFGTWTAHELELIRSELSSEGAHYTTLATFPLSCDNFI